MFDDVVNSGLCMGYVLEGGELCENLMIVRSCFVILLFGNV